ncbi:alpha/beta hydrolase [Candidatus Clostridium radicumherbarum]|uniref:Alpha/beta hydrolase n=1 Tax=Candidatus Clostridium radicumherbarum TaxID=3381662 RepID=A0ABW8TWJ5_9CLOT
MINKSVIKVKSSWGHEIENLYLTNSPKSDSLVVLFPGSGYICDKPLLYYARKATLLYGCDVLSLEYGYFRSNEEPSLDFKDRIVKESYEAVELCLSKSYENIYFISKSLGTVVAGEVSELIGYEKVKNLFLTPTKDTVKHILKSRCSIVVGTKDKFFTKGDIETVTNSSVSVHIIENAVHSLEVDDDYTKSIHILSEVTNICADFVRSNHKERG